MLNLMRPIGTVSGGRFGGGGRVFLHSEGARGAPEARLSHTGYGRNRARALACSMQIASRLHHSFPEARLKTTVKYSRL